MPRSGLSFDVGDPSLSRLLTESSMASHLGTRAVVFAEDGNEELAYHAAKMSWKWATWALTTASSLAQAVTR